jgi:Haem-binding uptake, Tiki superfamily, ChaN
MATILNLRRDNEVLALAAVEPQVRASDPTWRRKYLQDYAQAFRSYECVLDSSELEARISRADSILVGDYHALPACQHFAANLIKDRATIKDRPVVLAIETIFARDQHILDEWWRGEIGESELRQRIRFDLDWRYDWEPFYELISTAREHANGLYGLDCMPREDLRKISARDRHAAHKIAEIRERHLGSVIITLIGESHLAPSHLPALVREQLSGEDVLTILQNVDALYWPASEEPQPARAVSINDSTVCVFNSTPIEKYESYRLCLDRWSKEDEVEDCAPAIYSLIDELIRFLDINRHSPANGTQPRFLVDLFPEVLRPSIQQLRKLLSREGFRAKETKSVLMQLKDRGCVYLPQLNVFVVREFQTRYAAEEAALFLHHACQGLPLKSARFFNQSDDQVHEETLKHALAYLGSRILSRISEQRSSMPPKSRSRVRETQTGQEGVRHSSCGGRLSRSKAKDRDYGSSYVSMDGRLLGQGLYSAYEKGLLSRSDLRRIFLVSIQEPEKARDLCAQLSRKIHLTA